MANLLVREALLEEEKEEENRVHKEISRVQESRAEPYSRLTLGDLNGFLFEHIVGRRRPIAGTCGLRI